MGGGLTDGRTNKQKSPCVLQGSLPKNEILFISVSFPGLCRQRHQTGQCPVGHRGEFPDVRPSILTSISPATPGWPQALSGLILVLQASPDLKSALQASNLPLRPLISPPGFKSALLASNLICRTQACPSDF